MLTMLPLIQKIFKTVIFRIKNISLKSLKAAHLHSSSVLNLFLVTKSIREPYLIINIVIYAMFFLLLLGMWLECHLWPLISVLGQLN